MHVEKVAVKVQNVNSSEHRTYKLKCISRLIRSYPSIIMDIFSYPIARHVRSKLLTSKYVTPKDFQGISAKNLSSATGLSDAEAKELLELFGANDGTKIGQPYPSLTATELLGQSSKNRFITTSSKKVDEMLGGGIPLWKLTEICGIPGSGKTQLCLQLALNAQTQNSLGELRGEVLYIDTEGSFSAERLADMAKAAAETGDAGLSVSKAISGVHYRRCLDCESFLDTINMLHDFISSHVKVRLIIIDNIAYHFRRNFDSNYKMRMRTMHNVAQILAELAHNHSIAVVLTNQMTTRFDRDGQPVMVPSLGDSWGHACCNRMVLSFDNEARLATLLKSSYRPFSKAFFQIETAGIRDILAQAQNHPSSTIAGQLGFYEKSIGTSEDKANDYRDVQDHLQGDENSVMCAVAKRPRLGKD